MNMDEKELIRLTSEGDENAFRQLFDYYYPRTRVFFSKYTRNIEDARDLAQNIFVKLWTLRNTLPDLISFPAYLYRICRNSAIDYARKHRIMLDIEENFAETDSLDEDYFAREMRSRMESRIAQMPEKRRRVIMMSRIEGKSNEEIADEMGITKKTVENHLNAALKELRKLSSCFVFFL